MEFKCRLFSPEAACEVIEAERHSHVFYEAEPDIWMVMVRHYQLFFLLWHLNCTSFGCIKENKI